MKTQFYILGLLLRYGPQHGYMLKQTVEEQISDFAKIKLPNIYYTLERLNEKGYVIASSQKDGNRPEKTVYSITDKGEEHFYLLLKKMQDEELNLELPMDGAIFFGERVDQKDFARSVDKQISILQDKLKRVEKERDDVLNSIPDQGKAGTRIIFEHHICHIRAELEWLSKIKKEF